MTPDSVPPNSDRLSDSDAVKASASVSSPEVAAASITGEVIAVSAKV